jgi:hypothetical protein
MIYYSLMEKPDKGSARITYNGMEMQVVLDGIRYPFSIIFTVFICAMFVLWGLNIGNFLGKVTSTINTGATSGMIFYILSTVIWIGGGIFGIYLLGWTWTRREIITVSSNTLKVRRKIMGIGRARQYSILNIKNLRLNNIDSSSKGLSSSLSGSKGLDVWRLALGSLEFDYGMMTVDFARGINRPEALYLLNLFQERGIPVSSTGT